ncbi:unnamed protein product, partial [Sphenostylis stenocarpa]
MDVCVKEEVLETPIERKPRNGAVSVPPPSSVIELSSSSSSSDSDSENDVDLDSVVASALQNGGSSSKKQRTGDGGMILPVGFLSPLPPAPASPPAPLMSLPPPEWASNSASRSNVCMSSGANSSKQFWKAGDYDGAPCDGFGSSTVGMDHVRVHPKFLHSNATSHKWALGGKIGYVSVAFAELLDNSLDEEHNRSDNGGGMDPDKMRQCMSLGYSAKSKLANTIGQSRSVLTNLRISCPCKACLLSYTFLRSTGKEDIVVPMLDYERRGQQWNKIIRTSLDDWNKNVETMVQWSPFSNEADLLRQFNLVKDHGTRVIIYNLWEDDQGQLELDFDADPHDIQIRGVNRDEKNIQMSKEFPNSRHFLTYRHSLRSYASILYLRLPSSFRIILRGKDILHHNIVNDMMMSQEVTYRPQAGVDGLLPKDSNMVAVVTIGFVKDAVHHVDVSGFNVYHKNRLIKPFWRIWNPAGSGGRGVIGVLEANFVEPAHDKQGFERTLVLSRLESKLVQMQKKYWSTNCHKIGYASNRNKTQIRDSAEK